MRMPALGNFRVMLGLYGDFPKLKVPWGSLKIRTIVIILGSILGYPNFGRLPYGDNGKQHGNYYLGFGV